MVGKLGRLFSAMTGWRKKGRRNARARQTSGSTGVFGLATPFVKLFFKIGYWMGIPLLIASTALLAFLVPPIGIPAFIAIAGVVGGRMLFSLFSKKSSASVGSTIEKNKNSLKNMFLGIADSAGDALEVRKRKVAEARQSQYALLDEDIVKTIVGVFHEEAVDMQLGLVEALIAEESSGALWAESHEACKKYPAEMLKLYDKLCSVAGDDDRVLAVKNKVGTMLSEMPQEYQTDQEKFAKLSEVAQELDEDGQLKYPFACKWVIQEFPTTAEGIASKFWDGFENKAWWKAYRDVNKGNESSTTATVLQGTSAVVGGSKDVRDQSISQPSTVGGVGEIELEDQVDLKDRIRKVQGDGNVTSRSPK